MIRLVQISRFYHNYDLGDLAKDFSIVAKGEFWAISKHRDPQKLLHRLFIIGK